MFAKAQASETQYAVTVFKQPTNQFFGVTNGAGTVGSKNVTSVLISCGGYGGAGVSATGGGAGSIVITLLH